MLPELIRLTSMVSTADIRLVRFDESWGMGKTNRGRVVPDVERIREAIRLTLDSHGDAAELGATTIEASC